MSAPGFASSDGRPLTYAWDFGDGTSETTTTAATSHVFINSGRFEVLVNASNPTGQSASASLAPIDVSTVSGSWEGLFYIQSWPMPFVLHQDGRTVRGTGAYGDSTTTIAGQLSDPRRLELEVTVLPVPGRNDSAWSWSLSGQVAPSLDRIDAVVTLKGGYPCPCPGPMIRK